MPDSIIVDFQPLGNRVSAQSGATLLDIARSAGIELVSVCGGAGTCLECRIQTISGQFSPVNSIEEAAFSSEELSAGWRLACQSRVTTSARIFTPPDSLTTAQRLQTEGIETHISVDPVISSPGALGLAVDIGTTKLAVYLVDLNNGQTIAREGATNPQIAYGEDIISRIAYVTRQPEGAKHLQQLLIDAINDLLSVICARTSSRRDAIADAVFVGNTAMHHLAAGLPVHQLGRSPFAPATTEPVSLVAEQIGLKIASDAHIYLPPVIAGYVGADHLAMLIACGFSPSATSHPGKYLALDIGTNTELALIVDNEITCCSCASGPAFEGAHIKEGMRASPGAIEHARWHKGKILLQTIANQSPVGICGSGILDIVAALLDGDLLLPSGKLTSGSDYPLVPQSENNLGRDLMVTRKDIHEIQLAKAAIRAGMEVLLASSGLTAEDLDGIVIAGAFGTYLSVRSAVRVGMFPPIPSSSFTQVGNAAGEGGRQMLISLKKRRAAEQLARYIKYVELATNPTFKDSFLFHLLF